MEPRLPLSQRVLAVLLPIVAMGLVSVAQLWPGLSQDLSPPVSWDHGMHLGKAILTWERLPSLRGWTDLVETGTPLNTVYTATGTLLILAVRVFTQHLAWHQTYALSVVAFRTIVGLSVVRLGRVLRAGWLGALLGGFLALADFGDHSEGGWFYDVLYGVWPMSLAMAIFFFGVADLLEYLDARDDDAKRRFGVRATVLLGVALFSHQATLLAMGAVLPALVLVRLTQRGEDLRRDLPRLAWVLVVAGLISAWWLLPMFGFTAWLDDHGQLYRSTGETGGGFLAGEGILRGGHWESALTALGLVYGLFAIGSTSTDGRRRALAGAALLAMFIGSPGWLLELDLFRYLPSLGRIVFPRMMMIAKPIAFALAGVVLGELLAQLGRSIGGVVRTPRGAAALVLSGIAIAPFLTQLPQKLDELAIHRDVPVAASSGEWTSWNEAWRWVRTRRAEGANEGFYRVFYFFQGSHLAQASGAYTGVPAHIEGVLVGEAFRNTPDGTHPDGLRAVNVRYVVAQQPLPHPLASQVDLVATAGSAQIYELRDWSSEVVSDVHGEAHPDVRNYEDERIVFDPRGATELLVRRAYAPPMRAYADGVEVPIHPQGGFVDNPHLRLMRVDVPAGTARVEVVYAGLGMRGLFGWLGTLLGVVIALLWRLERRWPVPLRIAFARAREALRTRYEGFRAARPRFVALAERHGAHAALALPVLAFGLLVAKEARGYHVARNLDDVVLAHRPRAARAASEATEALPCSGGAGRCAEAGGLTLQRESVCVDGWFRSCITAGPPSRETLIVELPEAPARGTLLLGGGVSDDAWQRGDGAPITVRALRGDRELGTLSIPNGRHWETASFPVEGDGLLRLEIDGGAPGRRGFCFDAIVR